MFGYSGSRTGIPVSSLYPSHSTDTLGSVCLKTMNMYTQGGSNMTGTNCDLFTHKSSPSYLNHLVYILTTLRSHTKETVLLYLR
jgi:hypothetical protein